MAAPIPNGPAPPRYRDAVMVATVVALLVIAHVALKSDRYTTHRAGNVINLHPWELSSYEGDALRLRPTLVWLGSSQQFANAPTEPNGRILVNDPALLDVFAPEYERRHPATVARTYMNLGAPNLSLLDFVACFGLWFSRAAPDTKIVVVALEAIEANPNPGIQTIGILNHYPAYQAELEATLVKYPEGTDAVETFHRFEKKKHTTFGDDVEAKLQLWSWEHKLYYGDRNTPISTTRIYQKAEAPILKSIFGRVVQPGAPPPGPPGPRDYPFLVTTLDFFKGKGIQPICYAQPWNPASLPRTKRSDAMVDDLRQHAMDAGCSYFIDATHAASAPEDWGYSGVSPDPGHLTATGHRDLGKFLVEEGDRIGAWSELERAGHAEGTP